MFKGMHGDAFPGNQQCIQLAKRLDAQVFEYTEGAAATAVIKQQQPKQLILIGYSAGVRTAMQVGQQYTPALTVFIAGYPTTLLQGEAGVKGPYVNYYQQKELDSILASKGMKPYRPQGGEPVAVDAEHARIVAAVSADIVARVNSLG